MSRARDEGQEAPPSNLPSWDSCRTKVECGKASALENFIYKYDDSDEVGSAWFRHRLELLLAEEKS